MNYESLKLTSGSSDFRFQLSARTGFQAEMEAGLQAAQKDSEARRAKFDELRRTLQYVEASRASGTKHMRLFSGLLAVQIGFRKNYMGDAFIGKLSCFISRRRAVNRPLFSLPLVNLPRLIGKPRSDVFEILLNVMVNLK